MRQQPGIGKGLSFLPMDSIERKNWETYTRLYSTSTGHVRAGYGEMRKTAKVLEAAQSLYAALEGVAVLDIGFGAGHSILALAARGAQCTGAEISLGAAQHVASRARARELTGTVRSAVADGYNLPFVDCSFDLVVSSHVIEHLRDDVAAMREIGRVLCPGGSLILLVPNERYVVGNELHYRHYTQVAIRELVECSGLRLQYRQDYRSSWDDIFIALTNRRPFNVGVYLALPLLRQLFFVDEFCSRHWGGRESILVLKKPNMVCR